MDSPILIEKTYFLRPHIHGAHDFRPTLFRRPVFKPFPNPVEEHNPYRFWIFTDDESPYGGDSHEEVFVKHLTLANILASRPQDWISDHKLDDSKDNHLRLLR